MKLNLPNSIGRFIAAMVCCFTLPAAAEVVDVRVHDPVMIEADGRFYLFCTGRGVKVLSSSNLVDWRREPAVFDEAREWTNTVVPDFHNYIWAPDIAHQNGMYYLYYSVSAFGKNTSAIGVATNKTLDSENPDYEWVDHGKVIQSIPGRDLWNAIDPHLIFDEAGTPWLSFGSFWAGIKQVKLSDELTHVHPQQEWQTLAKRPRDWRLDAADPGTGAIEAPFIFKKQDYYYLFVSVGYCCRGADSDYRIVVGRAEEVSGPYFDKTGKKMTGGGGTLVVEGNSNWPGVGHNAVYTIDETDYLVCHIYDASERGRAKLLINPIEWDEAMWPKVSLPR